MKKHRHHSPPRERIPQSEVFGWLQTNYPDLFKVAEAERAWVWIACGSTLPDAQAKAIQEYGFILSKKGGHLLPSGRLGLYGHSCEFPLPFRRRFHPRNPNPQPQPQQPGQTIVPQPPQPQPEPAEPDDTEQQLEAEALAFLNAA